MSIATRSSLQALYEETAREFAAGVRRELGDAVHSVVLYGSVARRKAGRESDIDVLVLTQRHDKQMRERLWDISDDLTLERDDTPLLTVMSMTPEELEVLRKGAFPIAANILREGIVLYDDGSFERWKEMGPVDIGPHSEYVKTQLEWADKMLADARLLYAAGRVESAADRAYYAIFHSVQAALGAYGVQPGKTPRGVHTQFSGQFVKTGILSKEYSDDLRDARKMREESTYGPPVGGPGVRVDQDTVADILEKAEGFLQRIKRLVAEEPP